MAKPRTNKPKGRQGDHQPVPAPDRHKNPPIAFRPDAELRSALQAEADVEERNLAQMVAVLVREALRARGKWKPKPAGEASQQED